MSKEFIAKLIESKKELFAKRYVPEIDCPIFEDYSEVL